MRSSVRKRLGAKKKKKRTDSVVVATTSDHTQAMEEVTLPKSRAKGDLLHGVSAIPVKTSSEKKKFRVSRVTRRCVKQREKKGPPLGVIQQGGQRKQSKSQLLSPISSNLSTRSRSMLFLLHVHLAVSRPQLTSRTSTVHITLKCRLLVSFHIEMPPSCVVSHCLQSSDCFFCESAREDKSLFCKHYTKKVDKAVPVRVLCRTWNLVARAWDPHKNLFRSQRSSCSGM